MVRPPAPRLTDEEWDRLHERTRARIRELDPALLDAMDAEERGGRHLTHDERARLDALLTGTGYVVGGRRVAPELVTVYRAPGDHERRLEAVMAALRGARAIGAETEHEAEQDCEPEWLRRTAEAVLAAADTRA